jgi:hypothetical protein
MGLVRYKLKNLSSYDNMFAEIKAWLEENAQDYFTEIKIEEPTDNKIFSDDKLYLRCFNGNNEIIRFVYRPANGNLLYTASYDGNGYVIHELNNAIIGYTNRLDLCYTGTSARECIITDIIRTTHGIGFTFNYTDCGLTYKTVSTIILTKTINDNIAIIRPSEFTYNSSSRNLYANGSTTTNYLRCTTNKTTGLYNMNIQYFSAIVGSKMELVPVPVMGDNDYCPYAFYTPLTNIPMNAYSDCVFEYNLEQYYYNGFIALKL